MCGSDCIINQYVLVWFILILLQDIDKVYLSQTSLVYFIILVQKYRIMLHVLFWRARAEFTSCLFFYVSGLFVKVRPVF